MRMYVIQINNLILELFKCNKLYGTLVLSKYIRVYKMPDSHENM